MKKIIISVLAIFCSVAVVRLIIDIVQHKEEVMDEKGSIPRYICMELVVFFLACAGISDTALNVFCFRKLDGNVKDKLLPGTVICGAMIPMSIMGMTYTSIVKVDLKLLVMCVAASAAGSILGVRLIASWNERVVRYVMAIALAASALLILFRVFFFGLQSGNLISLPMPKLIITVCCFFIFGALNMMGVGATIPDMVILLLMGMDLHAIYPIVTFSNGFGAILGGMEFIRQGEYTRKVAIASFFSWPTVLLGVRLVSGMDVKYIQVLIIMLLIYLSTDLILANRQSEKKV